MIHGVRAVLVVFTVLICAVFAVAWNFGGWAAFGLALFISLLCLVGVIVWLSRLEGRRLDYLDALKEGRKPDDPGSDELGRALAALGEAMSDTCKQEMHFENALRGLGFPAVVCGTDGRIELVTKSLVRLLKKPEDEIIGKKVGRAFYNDDRVAITDKVLKSGKDVHDTLEITLWDGNTVPIKVYVNLIKGKDGASAGVVASFIDISDTLVQQAEIEQQKAEMARAGEHLSGLAEHVASATELLSASADDQAHGAQKQRRQTTAVAASMDQMTETVLAVAKNAAVTSEAADKAQDSAAQGADLVNKAVGAINEVAESAGKLALEIGQLDTQAAEIGRIIGVINDIADQTNLLALNAAIEAARAGEAGRGFAVVADEVRKLAEKTMTATKEVEEAISTIQKRSGAAIKSMRQTESQVSSSTDLSNQAGAALRQIMESITAMVERVTEIATAAEQQSSAAEEINRSIDEIAEIAGDADEAAGQAASATRDLAGLAQELLNVSKSFMQGSGEGRLRDSKGKMKGVLPKLAQGYIREKFPPTVFAAVKKEMGSPVFLPTESYPDQVLMQMAELASDSAGISKRDFFLGLGRYTVIKFHEMYPSYFKEESLKEFYLRMNEVHAKLTKDQPGIKPPNFTYEDKGGTLFMNYRSSRGLFDYFEGILLGAADFKGEKISVRVKPFDDTTARAEIAFRGKA